MLQPNRHGNSGNYRFGFNGKENDNEIKGEGNSIDYGARMFDPRIGRWYSLDKLMSKYPDLTPYHFVANTPIRAKEIDGKDFIILGSKEYRARVTQLLRDMYNISPTAREAITEIAKSDKIFLIVENEQLAAVEGNLYKSYGSSKAEGYMIFSFEKSQEALDPSNGANNEALPQTTETNFGHELGHMFDDLNEVSRLPSIYEKRSSGQVSLSSIEVNAVKFENKIRAESGLKLRTHYLGFNVFNKKAMDITGKTGFSQSTLVDDDYDFTQHSPMNSVKINLNEVFKSDNWWDLKFKVNNEKRGHKSFGFDGSVVPNTKSNSEEFTRIKIEE